MDKSTSSLTRRRFLELAAKSVAATALGPTILSTAGSIAEASVKSKDGKDRRPNILYILNDHQAFYGHGTYGGPKIQRPNFEKFAAGGVEFSRAYCASPLCGPSRRTMLTGLYPHNHGEIKNDVNHEYDREVYLDILNANGYDNYYYGKWHAGPGTAKQHGAQGFNYPSYNNPYTKPEYKEYLQRKNLPDFEVRIERSFLCSKEDAEKARANNPDAPRAAVPGEIYHLHGAWCNPHVTGVLTSPEETHEAIFLANLACDQLKKLAASGGEKPWSMRVDFWGPHAPYFTSQRFRNLYDEKKIPEYPSFNDDLSDKPEIYKSEHNYPLNKDGKIIHPNPLPWPEWQKTLAMHYAQSSLVDHAGGMILDMLEKLGLAEDTIVIWSTDHGDAVACHGGHFDKDGYMPEEMLRIPMAVRWPGKIKPKQKLSSLVSNIDLAPTFLDAAGLSFSKPVDGKSLLPLCTGKDKKWREDVMCETHGHFSTRAGRMVATDRYKYIWNDGDLEELYDLKSDPNELKNLIKSKDHESVLKDMRERLAKWQERTHDNPMSPDSYYQKARKPRQPKKES